VPMMSLLLEIFFPESMNADVSRFQELTADSEDGRGTPEDREDGGADGKDQYLRQRYDTDTSVYLPSDFRYFMSTPPSSQEQIATEDDRGNEMEQSSLPEQARILFQFGPDPSLRINNGPPPLRSSRGGRERGTGGAQQWGHLPPK
jgi:hypothetical protein